MTRRVLLRVLTVLSVLSVLAATVMVFAQDRLFDADDFATTLASALQDPAVNDYLAEVVTEELTAQVPNLAVAGPLLTDVTSSVLESDTAVRIVEVSAQQAHRVAFTEGESTLVLELSDLVVSVQQALQAISPELAESIPGEVETLTVALSSGELTAGTVQLAEQLRALTFVLVAVSVVLLIAIAFLEPSLFRGLTRLGGILGFVGLLLIVLVATGAIVLATYSSDPLEIEALIAAWAIVLGDLASWGWILVVLGALLASVGWAVANVGNVIGRATELGRRVIEPGTTRAEIVRNAALGLGAVWALVSPLSLMSAAIRVGGFVVAVVVLARLLDRTGLAARLQKLEAAAEDHGVVSIGSVGARLGVTAAVLLVLGFGAAVLLASDDEVSALFDPNACNGHVELCDRRLDQVTMAAAHNSMSSTATDFYLPNHLSSMRTMLDEGVRGFMIDTIYGRAATDGSVQTSLGLGDVDSLDEQARIASEAVQARQTEDLGPENRLPLPRVLRDRLARRRGGADHPPRLARREPTRGRHRSARLRSSAANRIAAWPTLHSSS